MKTVGSIALLLALLGVSGTVTAQVAPARRALLVGISDYASYPRLAGASRDVQLMRNVLIGRFNFAPGDIQVLTDNAATEAGVRAALHQLADQTTPDAVVVIHFSGYGSQLPDDGHEEIDGLDETFVMADATPEGAGEIRDDDVEKLIAPIRAKTQRLTVIADTCYVSATPRAGSAERCLARSRVESTPLTKSSGAYSTGNPRESASFDRLNAAKPPLISNEAVFGSGPYGAFTYELANALVNLPGTPSYKDVYERVSARVRTRFPTQEINFQTVDPTAPMFHDAGMRPEFAAVIRPAEKGTVSVMAGRFHGVERGNRLEVFPPGTTDFAAARAIAAVEITQMGDLSSMGRLVGSRSIPAGALARRAVVVDSARLSLWFEAGESAPHADLAGLKQRLRGDPRITVVDSPAEALLQVVSRDDGFAVLSGDLTPLRFGIRSVAELHEAVQGLVRWFTVLRLNNPSSPLSIDLTLRRSKPDEPLRGVVRPGETIEYTITNTSTRRLYAHALLMSSDGTISTAVADPVSIESKAVYTQRLGTFLEDNQQRVTDYIKVFASPVPIDLAQWVKRSEFDGEHLRKVEWTSAQVSYEMRRAGTRVTSFAILLGPGARSAPAKSPGQRAICGPNGKCVTGRALDSEGTFLVVDGVDGRSTGDETHPGAAFQEAYEKRDELKAERVEPLFEVAMGADLPGLEGRSSGGGANDKAAADDMSWSLNYVKAPAAWAVMQRAGRSAGREAYGVRIAHLDTGYREHPEFFSQEGDYSTLDVKAGFDLVDGGEPFDTLSTSGAFPNPGHGTASGSVIVSLRGCQLKEGITPCVTGVALGAQLVPVRVNTSVVVLNQRRLTEAIMGAVEGRLVKKPQIISIAMGGPPSWSLWRAVKAAEAAGIIIVAAAGNNVGTVAGPARYDSVVAAGAINVRCRPWSGSSHGSRVDISAPGESVWRAQVDREQQANVIGMGTGTTFATAITTGAAALWVAKYQDSNDFKSLANSGGLTEAFRSAIRETAWRPVAADGSRPKTHCENDVGWNANENGAGILNIEAMLERPIDVIGARSARIRESELPLFESVYPRGVDAARVSGDYESLFPPGKRMDIHQFEAEVMFHYADNETVRNAIDRIVAGARQPEDYDRVVRALRYADLSERLRKRLEQ